MSVMSARSSSILAVSALVLSPVIARAAVPWFPFGPDGGSARSIAADPRDHAHLYLGTETGWIYESRDEGHAWKRLSRIGQHDDLVLDNIVVDSVDSHHLVAAGFMVGRADGGLYSSKDGGATWVAQSSLQGQSIRALAQSASNPKLWVAGTLTGVQQSTDDGEHWTLISPPQSSELHEVESVAIDPKDPRVIYAGTWHLPWKTSDGGRHWANIKEGVIDDSDVFSIIVDPVHPSTVYASACSGIYKSENGGGRFQKVEGIPSEARRTRVLMQDPKNRDVVFAGTTEGLFRTGDAGKIWIRMTGPDVIVNDVYIDPTDSNKVLLATDRSGVLASTDGGSSFYPANAGFSARHLSSYVADSRHPATVYVGALNDKQWGGVFRSMNGGLSWTQQSEGLDGRDVFSLGQGPDGTIVAGTSHGLYQLKDATWQKAGDVAADAPVKPASRGRTAKGQKKTVPHRTPHHVATTHRQFDDAVYAIAMAGEQLFAATAQGLLVSRNSGSAWEVVSSSLPAAELYFLGAAHSKIIVADLHSIFLSPDEGVTWGPVSAPPSLSQLTAVAVDDMGGIWAGGREGIFFSTDQGATWRTLNSLFVNDIDSIYFDAASQRVFVTSSGASTLAFSVHLPDDKVTFWDAGWNLRFVRPVGDHLLGVTPFDGVVIQPRMVESSEANHP